MATMIKRSLYIGLGGTGIKALVNTKRMFIETYGEVPPMVAFLGIDTDKGEYRKVHTTGPGNESVLLDSVETMPISVENAQQIFKVNEEHFGWVPAKNRYALVNMNKGAGQIRTNGRFALTVHFEEVKNKILSTINQMTNASITRNDKYELLSSEIEIHLVFSLCGGTGAGTFLNMAYLLKDIAPTCKLTGYGVLPDIFEAMSSVGMSKVKPNAYASIKDLDYLMHFDGTQQIEFDYIRHHISSNLKPFNAFFFIDNKNSSLDTYNDISEIAELISLVLVTSAGELSTASASVIDNLEKNIMEGNMDVEDKRAWASGLGACEIVFHGDTLQKIYAYQGVKTLIDSLLSAKGDTADIVANWIDKDDVNIRENNDQDNVLNYLLDLQPDHPFLEFDDPENAKNELELWINNVAFNREKLQKALDERCAMLKERVGKALTFMLMENINCEGGLGTTYNIVKGLQTNVELFLEEMNNEITELREHTIPNRQSQLNVTTNDLVDYCRKFFKSKSNLAELAENTINAAGNLVNALRDELRHQVAIRFFTDLKVRLDKEENHLKTIRQQLRKIYNDMDLEIARYRNAIEQSPRTFQINLARDIRVTVNPEDLSMTDFVNTLHSPHKILDFDKYDSDELFQVFYNFCSEQKQAKAYGERTVDDVIDQMSDEEFNRLMRLAAQKSEPLFRTDYHGYTPVERPASNFYIGVNNKSNSRLRKDDAFKLQLEGNQNVDFANIGQKDRIIIYRQCGVSPAFTLAGLPDYRSKYENMSNCDCHFDFDIETRMQRENFQLKPAEKQDETLEFWVKGLLFGLIKHENGLYWMKNELNDALALDDYWEKLSEYRDEAFKHFKQRIGLVSESFDKFINQYCQSKGSTTIQQFINEVKNGQNYLLKYAQVNMSPEEIKKKGNEPVQQLMIDEINFVKKEL